MGPTLLPGGHHTAWCLQAQLATHAWHLPWGSQGLGALGWGVEVSMLLLHPGKLHNRQATQTHPPSGMPASERVQQCALGPRTTKPITAKHSKVQQSAAKCSKAQQSAAKCSKVQQSAAKHNKAKQSKVQQSTTKHHKVQQSAAKYSKVQQSATKYSKVQQSTAKCSKVKHCTLGGPRCLQCKF